MSLSTPNNPNPIDEAIKLSKVPDWWGIIAYLHKTEYSCCTSPRWRLLDSESTRLGDFGATCASLRVTTTERAEEQWYTSVLDNVFPRETKADADAWRGEDQVEILEFNVALLEVMWEEAREFIESGDLPAEWEDCVGPGDFVAMKISGCLGDIRRMLDHAKRETA